MTAKTSIHGQAMPHDTAALQVMGQARYVDDIALPANALHIAFGQSSIARGTIKSMDLSAVRAAPGVRMVFTADDLPFENDVSPSNHDEPLLATQEVHYIGQPIFAVVAQSHHAARRAAKLAQITYDEETPVLTVEEALAHEARFEDGPRIYESGDAKAAVDAAPHVIEGTIDIGGQEHFYLEGQAALAIPQEGGDMHIISSTQHPTEIQHKVAEAIGVPMHAVRVECRRMGGGFGGKESQGNALAVICAIAARATGVACKMRYDRDDDMMITGKRHDFKIRYRAGFDDMGRVEGVEFWHYTRGGWSMDLTLPVADRAMLHADNAYDLPACRIESHRLKTNMQSATAYRGFGGPQGIVGIERVMDQIAHHLGRDPLEIRQINYYDAPAEPSAGGLAPQTPESISRRMKRNVTPYGMAVTDFILNEMTQDLAVRADYAARRAQIAQWNAGSPILKRGIALTPVKFGISFTLTHLNQAGALVHVYQDGSIHLNHGGTEMGQGLFRKVSQVAARVFGVDVDAIKITATDTAKVPNTSATAASSGTDLNGMAVQVACQTIRNRMVEELARQSGVAPSAVRFEGGQVHIGEASLSFGAAAARVYQARVSLSSTGFYKTPDLAWDRIKGTGRPFYYFAYGAAVSEVVIDTLTGENRILRTDILHDAGASLNPALDIGQVEGGYVQGAGWLTMEELVWDGSGRLRTHAPSTYKIPAVSDRPVEFNVHLWDQPSLVDTVYRSKAVGEPPFVHGISVLMAISDAISHCGPEYPALDAPATPERILQTIRRVQHV